MVLIVVGFVKNYHDKNDMWTYLSLTCRYCPPCVTEESNLW